jgi:S1-C subfamily serine protease
MAPERASYGFTVQDLTPQLARDFNDGDQRGVLVSSVSPGSAAEASGLRTNDIILEVNRKAVKNANAYRQEIVAAEARRVMVLLVRRGKGTLFIPLKPTG